MQTTHTSDNSRVKIIANDRGNPPGKLADAELHFNHGLLAGLKLVGFSIRERRSFALLRPIGGVTAQNAVGERILDAYAEYESGNERS